MIEHAVAALARTDPAAFAAASPFPHVVLDDFLPVDVADRLAAEFDGVGAAWKAYHHVNEKKLVASDVATMGPTARAVIAAFHADAFVAALETVVGADGLRVDPELDGAGLQQTRAGGFLNVHLDHLSHAKRRTWSRQVNLLLFLNRGWDASWGGTLELWDASVTRRVRAIEPAFNRCVVFRTSERSYHGVVPVTCPAERARRSLALYYYRDEGRPLPLQPTRYVPRPGDGPLRRALIHADRWALGVYSALKRYTPIDDRLISRLLRWF
jgi:Rps23 Pro-64 3,4-dihydroxylase Tpa1-like proline 4-hydroxylase